MKAKNPHAEECARPGRCNVKNPAHVRPRSRLLRIFRGILYATGVPAANRQGAVGGRYTIGKSHIAAPGTGALRPDPEHSHAHDQGAGIPWRELLLALVCFYGTLLWANTAGGWIKLSRRINRWFKRRRSAKENFQVKSTNASHPQIP